MAIEGIKMNREKLKEIVEFVMFETVSAVVVDEIDTITDKLIKSMKDKEGSE